MQGPGRLAGIVAAALATLTWTTAAPAIETDQYYAWGRELKDSTEVLNAKVNSEILLVLEEINANRSWPALDCFNVARRINGHFRLFIFHDLELWANNTSLVERIPATPEEERLFRRRYIYGNDHPLNVGTWMPPSPTIEVAGVRIGTDKLTHFFSEGWMSYGWYRSGVEKGLSPGDAEMRAIDRGILLERSILGMAASGVFSLADLEANYQGMLFFRDLCETDSPVLQKGSEGWRMNRPFDLRDRVSPEWDESWQPCVFAKRRWKSVEPTLRSYCHLLQNPDVVRRRERYAREDRETVTESRVRELVRKGKLADPRSFSIEQVCAGDPDSGEREERSGSGDVSVEKR